MLKLTRGEAIDQISDVLSDIYEMDTPRWLYATRVVEHLTARGVMFVRKSDDPEITEAEVQAAFRVLQNWGGLRDQDANPSAIVKTMLMAAANVRTPLARA